MSDEEPASKKPPVPPELLRYVRDPVPEYFTAEIFEDLHAVVDTHLMELAGREDEPAVVEAWEAEHADEIEARREKLHSQFGTWLPHTFISAEVKMEYLVRQQHPGYQGGVPPEVVEVFEEFLEIIRYRDELGEPPANKQDS